jgi:glycosyltransferase involved in cell wall biosynthesis
MPSPPQLRLVVAMPIRDDAAAARIVVADLDRVAARLPHRLRVLLIDDGSEPSLASTLVPDPLAALERVEVLRLRRNLGHQRAIAVALAHIHEAIPCDAVLIMDGDGEDRPDDVPTLVDAFLGAGGSAVVFARRIRRADSLLTRTFYHVYRLVHWLLTGVAVRVGNFSIVPASRLPALTVASEIWNHYAAAVYRTRLPRASVPIARGRRVAGRSTMNFVALVTHGMSAISVFADIAGVRLLILTAAIAGVALAAIPIGWRVMGAMAATLLLVLLLQSLLTALALVFLMLGSRPQANVIPARDYRWFVEEVRQLR